MFMGLFLGVITSLSYFQENARIIKYSYTPSTFSFICQEKKARLKKLLIGELEQLA